MAELWNISAGGGGGVAARPHAHPRAPRARLLALLPRAAGGGGVAARAARGATAARARLARSPPPVPVLVALQPALRRRGRAARRARGRRRLQEGRRRSKISSETEKEMVVQTVLGAVEASRLGRTLTHEHLALDFSHFYREPPAAAASLRERLAAPPPLALGSLGALRQYPYSSRYNLRFGDEDARRAVLADVVAYKKDGGGTIVENTTLGLGRDLPLMREASLASGAHVVAGTGRYVAALQAPAARGATVEQLYAHMLRELTERCDEDPTVRAGFMGEIASEWPIHEMEKRAIVAAGEVQAQTGHGVSFHPHRLPAAPAHIMRLYLEAGGRADKAVMSHLDRTLHEDAALLEFAELGCYCQLDLFGVECSYYQLAPETPMPSDAERVRRACLLVRDGRADRLLLSHDIHTKHRLTEFGGHGYSHIINNILPRLLERGLSQETVDTITIANPAAWLDTAPQ